MATPFAVKATATLLANQTSVAVSVTLPSTTYRVVVDLPYASHEIWITNKTTSGFTINVQDAPLQNMPLRCEIICNG